MSELSWLDYCMIFYGAVALFICFVSLAALVRKLIRERAHRRNIEAENLDRQKRLEEQKRNFPSRWAQLDFDFDYRMLRDRLVKQGYTEERRGLFTKPMRPLSPAA